MKKTRYIYAYWNLHRKSRSYNDRYFRFNWRIHLTIINLNHQHHHHHYQPTPIRWSDHFNVLTVQSVIKKRYNVLSTSLVTHPYKVTYYSSNLIIMRFERNANLRPRNSWQLRLGIFRLKQHLAFIVPWYTTCASASMLTYTSVNSSCLR